MSSNVSVMYSLAYENVVLSAPKTIHNGVCTFLDSSFPDKLPLLFVEIFCVTEDEIKKLLCELHVDLMKCKINKLDLAHFYFDEKQTMYIIRPCGLGVFHFDKRTITWYTDKKDLDDRNMFHIFVLDPISLVLPIKNKIVFHGASIRDDNSSVAFLGRSGNGKSTVSRLLTERSRYKKNSDDTFVVELSDNNVMLYPINSGEGYSYELAEQILLNNDDYKVLYRTEEKCYLLNTKADLSPQPLVKIFILKRQTNEKENYTNLFELDSSEALLHILNSQTNIIFPYLTRKMELYRMISKQVKITIVDYNNLCDVSKIII